MHILYRRNVFKILGVLMLSYGATLWLTTALMSKPSINEQAIQFSSPLIYIKHQLAWINSI